MLLKAKNWDRFQHYDNRCPPWIKLHRQLLDDKDYLSLPTASMALAPLLWLLCSENKQGVCEGDEEKLAWRLRKPVEFITEGLPHLLTAKFFTVIQGDASKVLAGSKQVAPKKCSEGEGEGEREREESIVGASPNLPQGVPSISLWKEAEELLTFLNQKTGKRFPPRQPNQKPTASLTLVHNLLKTGCQAQQIRQVIANRIMKWGTDPKMKEYLRPATLFLPSNFSNYVGELGPQSGAAQA